MRRRGVITLLGGAVAVWPLAARAQQPAMPVVGLVGGAGGDISTRYSTAFRKGLNETGIFEGQNATVQYHWLAGQYDRLPSIMSDLVRRSVAVIATPGSDPAALAAKAATTTIPIVFGVGEDPVKLGLVASLARPGGNATGINIFNVEIAAKRLGILHELVPNAARIAVLVNPANASSAESTLRYVPEAARAIGPHSQGRKGIQLAGCASDKIRVGDQSANREGIRPRSAHNAACPSRRGDRMIGRREFITLLGGAVAQRTDIDKSYRTRVR